MISCYISWFRKLSLTWAPGLRRDMLSYTHVICYIWPGKHCIIWLLQSYLHVELASTERNIPAKQFSGLTLASLQSDKFLKHHPGVKCAIRITNCGNMKKIPDSVSGGVVSKIDRGKSWGVLLLPVQTDCNVDVDLTQLYNQYSAPG